MLIVKPPKLVLDTRELNRSESFSASLQVPRVAVELRAAASVTWALLSLSWESWRRPARATFTLCRPSKTQVCYHA